MTDADRLRRQIVDALGHLDLPELETLARLARRLDALIGYGNPSFILDLPRYTKEDGIVRGEFEVREIHLNPHGVAHGMVSFGLVDNAMGLAVATHDDEFRLCVALEAKVQFVRALHPGRVAVEAGCLHRGRTVAVAEARIVDSGRRLSVLATGTYFLTAERLGGSAGR